MVDGRVLHRGAPQPGCRVIAGDEETGRVVAHAETGAAGTFELAVEDTEDVVVVALCAAQAIGVVAAPAGGALELELTSVAATHPLTVHVTGEDVPEWVRPQIRLMPLAVGSLNGRVLRWITAPVDGLSRRALARLVPEERRELQAGRWWIAADAFEERGVRAADQPDPRSWTTARAWTGDGTPLARVRSGFELAVDGPVEVTLELAERGR